MDHLMDKVHPKNIVQVWHKGSMHSSSRLGWSLGRWHENMLSPSGTSYDWKRLMKTIKTLLLPYKIGEGDREALDKER